MHGGSPKKTCSTRLKLVSLSGTFPSSNRELLAYGKAGYDNEAFEVLQQLAEKAVLESRFLDASYYFRVMARTYLAKVYSNESTRSIKKRIEEAIEKADAYYIYDAVFRYIVSIFNVHLHPILDGAVHREGRWCTFQYVPLPCSKATYRRNIESVISMLKRSFNVSETFCLPYPNWAKLLTTSKPPERP